MNKVSVTIEGASWGEVVKQMEEFVGRADYTPPQSITAALVADAHENAHNAEPPHIAAPQEFKPFATPNEFWPAGDCPKHKRPWKQGNYGPYCTSKDESGPKGYCVLKPGDIWNGKNIPVAA